MRGVTAGFALLCGMALVAACPVAAAEHAHEQKSYLGFDKNLYPGDALLPALHKEFAYTGFWLNDPPGMSANPWAGKRDVVRRAGFGFLILFNGRLDKELKHRGAAALGASDARAAVDSAHQEGFPAHALLFLDIEEGGRMLPEQVAYIGAWIAAVQKLGFRAGVYCSGINVPDGGDRTISTARDLAMRFPGVSLWVANDQCPPAPGCMPRPGSPADSGIPDALVWQFSQTPRRPQYTRACAKTYTGDGNCYAEGLPKSPATFLDLDTSRSPDPSGGR